MTHTHERYEGLTALATAGQLSDSELIELEQHLRECVACRQDMAAMEEVSRALFLAHTRNATRHTLPAGMQQRFQERARRAGIPLRRPVAGTLDGGVPRLALVTALLAVCAALSWKLVARSGVNVGRSDNTTQTANLQPLQEFPLANDLLSIEQKQRQPPRRKTTLLRKPVTKDFPERAALTSKRAFGFPQPSLLAVGYARTFSEGISTVPVTVSQQYMVSGLHLPKQPSFQSAILPITWGIDNRERTFHYKPDFASLTFLDGPQASGLTATPTFDFNRSPLHFNHTQTW